MIQGFAQVQREQVAAHFGHVVAQFIRGKADFLQHANVGLDAFVKKAAVGLGPGFHGQGKGRQLARPFVDLDTEKVVGENFFGNLGLLCAHFFVDGIQQVKRVGEHVARAAGRVADLDVFGFVDLEEVGLRLLRRDVVVHLPGQRRFGVVEHP